MDPLFKRLYAKSLRYLGLRLRSVEEMRKKLIEWLKASEMDPTIHESYIERVLAQLKKDTLLDDQRFAYEWLRSRLTYRGRGISIIKAELRQKGVAANAIENAYQQFQTEEVDKDPEETIEYSSAKALGEKFLRRHRGEEERVLRYKMLGYIAQRGYSSSLTRRVVDDLLGKGVQF